MYKKLLCRCFSTISTKIYDSNFPYTIGGFKKRNFNPNITFESGEEFFDFINIDENSRDKDQNLFSFYVSNLEMSKEFEKILNEKYISFAQEIYNFKLQSENLEKSALQNLEKSLNYKFFNNFISSKSGSNNNLSKYKLITDTNLNNSNEFYLDKIFLHLNVNKFNKEDSFLRKIENFYSKKLVIFNYGRIESEMDGINNMSLTSNKNISKRNMVVRMSIWAKINSPLIIENISTASNSYHNYDNKYKIYDDEWHHLLIEFEEDNYNLNFLKVLTPLSFPRIMSKLIIPNKNSFDISNFKIADFDFYMKGNPISSMEEQITKNELYYIKHKF
jgi:hypothetical protein